MGTVTVENEGLSGVKVVLSGVSGSETLTSANGQYAFTGLRAGNYTIEISGFDTDDIAFGATSSTAQVSVGESKVVSFDGTYLRASGVSGQVSVEGVGLAGVTVSLQGRGENFTEQTNAAGQFMFDKLRKGEYSVAISGYDDDEYGFETTSKTVTVARGETGNVPFEGIALRTAGIKGTVSVTGHGPLDGVTVSLSGKGEDMSVTTNPAGQWSFDRLHAGDYSVAITGFDRDEYGFDVTSENVTVALKETADGRVRGHPAAHGGDRGRGHGQGRRASGRDGHRVRRPEGRGVRSQDEHCRHVRGRRPARRRLLGDDLRVRHRRVRLRGHHQVGFGWGSARRPRWPSTASC